MTKPEFIFSKKDYNNPNGMLTSVWGPSFWHVLHTISVNYPVNPTCDDKANYKVFIMSLKNVLPCKYCRINLVKNLKVNPLNAEALKNRENFSKWVYKLHEVVNKSLGKKSGLTFREVQDRYEHFRARCSSDKKSNDKIAKDVNQIGGKNTKKNTKKNEKTHSGCTDSIYGVKAKCNLRIVPHTQKSDTFSMHKRCKGKKTTNKDNTRKEK